MGADIRGITVESCDNVSFNNVQIDRLESQNGSVIGVDVMFDSKNINGSVNVGEIKVIDPSKLPSNFDSEIPQNCPEGTKLNIFETSQANLNLSEEVSFSNDINIGFNEFSNDPLIN